MNRIDQTFAHLRETGRKAFIAYITAGDPSLDSTVRLVTELAANGVDIIELGIPFSDPIADGPVNQNAAYRALKNDVSLTRIFETIREIRKSSAIPLVLFAYYNTILQYGLTQFAPDARKVGVDGVLILDLPPEEAGEYKKRADAEGLSTIFLVSPVTPESRIERIALYASGFVYYVSQMGVTGERSSISESIPSMISRIRSYTDTPVAVGFGISTPEQVREIAGMADGIIVGSAIVKRIGENGGTPGFETGIGSFAGTLTASMKGPLHG
jgi:tryptophan synthase alpha chain